jgi:hypothetical protein
MRLPEIRGKKSVHIIDSGPAVDRQFTRLRDTHLKSVWETIEFAFQVSVTVSEEVEALIGGTNPGAGAVNRVGDVRTVNE